MLDKRGIQASMQEDQLLKHLFEEREIQKWSNIAEKINETFLFPIKTGKQCR